MSSMPRGGKTFLIYPTLEDRIVSVMHLNRGVMKDFTVQYDTILDGKWVEVTRIDTCHGSAHQHKFNPNNKEIIVEFFCNNYNEGFTQAKKFITENFEHMRHNYLTQATKRRL
ncbi:MAG: hypothetical protein ACHQT9_04340 [Candidatus Saccharimonadales bacterium]